MFSWTGFLLAPLAAASLIVGGFAVRTAIRDESGLRLPAIGTAVAAVVLLLALVAPGMLRPSYVSGDKSNPSESAIRVVPSPKYATAALSADWVDADKASLQQGRVRVEVAEAWVAPLPKKENPTGQRKWLHVRIRMYRIKTGAEIAAGAFAQTIAWDRKHKATLRNGDGPPSEQLAVNVAGRSSGSSSAAGETVDVADEILTFDTPTSWDGLRLELPASAWGGKGAFRFTVPASFIRTVHGTPVS